MAKGGQKGGERDARRDDRGRDRDRGRDDRDERSRPRRGGRGRRSSSSSSTSKATRRRRELRKAKEVLYSKDPNYRAWVDKEAEAVEEKKLQRQGDAMAKALDAKLGELIQSQQARVGAHAGGSQPPPASAGAASGTILDDANHHKLAEVVAEKLHKGNGKRKKDDNEWSPTPVASPRDDHTPHRRFSKGPPKQDADELSKSQVAWMLSEFSPSSSKKKLEITNYKKSHIADLIGERLQDRPFSLKVASFCQKNMPGKSLPRGRT